MPRVSAVRRRERRVQGPRRLWLHWRASSALAVLLLAFLSGCGDGAATSGSFTMTGRTPGQVRSSAGAGRAAAGDGGPNRLASAFALFHSPADGVPSRVTHALRAGSFPKMLWNDSRRVPVSLPESYWLIPGIRFVCLASLSPDSPVVRDVCATIKQALQHGLAITSVNPRSRERTIVGLAPDGVRSVHMVCARSSTNIRVRHQGVFTLRDLVAEGPETFLLRYR